MTDTPTTTRLSAELRKIIAGCVQEVNTLDNMNFTKREDLHARVSDELDATVTAILTALATTLEGLVLGEKKSVKESDIRSWEDGHQRVGYNQAIDQCTATLHSFVEELRNEER